MISPGPKSPEFAGISKNVIETYFKSTPILGVCLGMQCINEVFHGKTILAPEPVHGKTTLVRHSECGLFSGLENPTKVARYHSLMIKPALGSDLEITAMTDDDVIMGISHKKYCLHGVQFHPESFLTESGLQLLKNFVLLGQDYSKINSIQQKIKQQSQSLLKSKENPLFFSPKTELMNV